MRKLYRPFCFIAAVAAMSLTSCQKESFTPGTEEGTVITVHATVEDVANATKTHIDGTQVYWDQEEQMKVVSFDSAVPETSGKESNSSSFAPSADYTTATFTVTMNNEAANTIAGVYPASAAKGLSSINENPTNALKYKVELPANQIATANSYDPAAYIMITRPQTLPVENNEWNAYYIRAAALTRMEVSGLNDNIKSVTITFPTGQVAAGRRYFDLATSSAGEIYYGQTNEINVSYAEPLAAGTTQNVWFTSWNVDVTAGETITVKIQSDTKIYTKTFTATKAISLKENFLNIMPVDMNGASEEDINPAEDYSGEYLIVGLSGTWNYMTNSAESGYFASKATSISKEYSALSSADFYPEVGIEDCVWKFTSTGEGLYTITSADGKFLTITGKNASLNENEVSLYVEKQEDGSYWIKENSSTAYRLQYNSASPRFKPYDSDQKPTFLVQWTPSTEPMLVVNESEQTVAADAESVSFSYVARNITGSITAFEGTDDSNIISAVNVDETSSTVNVTLTPNTEEVEKTATITLSAEGVEPVTLTIIQKAYVAAGSTTTDILTANTFNVSGTNSYMNVSYTAESGAEYAGNMAQNTNSSIQMRSSKNNSGIVSKVSAGKVRKVEVVWDSSTSSDRSLDIYGSNEPYTGSDAAELYSSSTQGELLGSIVYGESTELTISGEYQYIGLRSKSGAMYLKEIKIIWEK